MIISQKLEDFESYKKNLIDLYRKGYKGIHSSDFRQYLMDGQHHYQTKYPSTLDLYIEYNIYEKTFSVYRIKHICQV